MTALGAHLMTAPLSQLYAEHGITATTSSIPDPDFFGAAIDAPDGLVLALPAGRTESETDTLARYLIGQALGADLPPLPGAEFTTL